MSLLSAFDVSLEETRNALQPRVFVLWRERTHTGFSLFAFRCVDIFPRTLLFAAMLNFVMGTVGITCITHFAFPLRLTPTY